MLENFEKVGVEIEEERLNRMVTVNCKSDIFDQFHNSILASILRYGYKQRRKDINCRISKLLVGSCFKLKLHAI